MEKKTDMRTKILRVIFAFAVILSSGCATQLTPQEMAKYFDTPSKVHFNEPVYIKVIDERPKEELKGSEWSKRYISTADGTDDSMVALVFAEDLGSLLLKKKIVNKVFVCMPHLSPPKNSTIVSVILKSWYGRVRDFSKLSYTEKTLVASMSYRSLELDNKGKCSFATIITRFGKKTNLGEVSGEEGGLIRGGGNMQHANILSGVAADRAFVAFLKAFEKAFIINKKE
jgi:hypothetical protein